jgi:hypothetical protein
MYSPWLYNANNLTTDAKYKLDLFLVNLNVNGYIPETETEIYLLIFLPFCNTATTNAMHKSQLLELITWWTAWRVIIPISTAPASLSL